MKFDEVLDEALKIKSDKAASEEKKSKNKKSRKFPSLTRPVVKGSVADKAE